MKKLSISSILCLFAIMGMSQVQGTIVTDATAGTVDIMAKASSTSSYSYPVKEFDFVVSIPTVAGVTATLGSSPFDNGSFTNWSTTTPAPTTANGKSYYAFHYFNQYATTNFSFANGAQNQLATVTFTGATMSNPIRLTDENSATFVNKWYIAINGDAGNDGSGGISATSSGTVYYGATSNPGSTIGGSGTYQYVETNSTILPIALSSFTATKAVDKVNIAWATATEANSASFLVQRSGNGVDFVPVVSVVAVGSGANRYATIDASPLNGTNFYRLKNMDKDGSFTYSGIVSVYFDADSKVSVYPSPASDVINVHVSTASLYGTVSQLVDFGGRTVQSFTIIGNAQQVNISSLEKGMYLLKFADGSYVKFIKN